MNAAAPVVALVAAVAENGVIGRGGRLPWRIPSELHHFRKLTMGKPVIMGRKTFASLGKPLPGRDNIVLTRDAGFKAEGAIIARMAEAALNEAQRCARVRAASEIMVIGGAEIYTELMPFAGRIHLTRVHARPGGDTYFPPIEPALWREVSRIYRQKADGDDHDYSVLILERAGPPPAGGH
ncbi:MAG: dihydrofolate reductase [Rhodomicrobium sp.]|nr:dihydrofolate reductase [Rhodomicrobium sp.]